MDLNRMRIPSEHDARRKLSDEDRNEIIRLRKEEGLSYEKIAHQFGVTTSAICQLFHRLEGRKKKPAAKSVYDPEKAKRYRERKKKLAAEGKLVERDYGKESSE